MKKIKKRYIGVAIFILLMVISAALRDDEAELEAKEKEVVEEKEEPEEEEKEDDEEPDEEEQEEDKLDEVSWDDVKDLDKIVGKSDKDYSSITKTKPDKVRNDNTGKWKKSVIAENLKMEEYALSYKDLYMEEGEIHFIINFNYNTTSKLSYLDSLLYLTITEYEKKEEHDARDIGSGMILGKYIIYPDRDVEEIPIDD